MEGSCSQYLLRFFLVLYLVSLQATPLYSARINVIQVQRNPLTDVVGVTEKDKIIAKPVDPATLATKVILTPGGTRQKVYSDAFPPFWIDFLDHPSDFQDPTNITEIENLTPYTGTDFNLEQIQIPDRPPDKEEIDRNMVLYTYYDDAFVDPKDLVYVIEPKLLPQEPEQIIEETFDLEREHFVLEDYMFGEPEFDLETVFLDQAPILINVTKEEKPADVKLYTDAEVQKEKTLEADVETPEQNIRFEETVAPGRPEEHYRINFFSRPNKTLIEQEEIIREGPPVEVQSVLYKQPQFDVTKIVRKADKPLHHRIVAKVYRNPDIVVNERLVHHPEKVVYFRNMKYPLVRYIVRYNLLSPAIVRHKISTIRYVKKAHGQPGSFEGFRKEIMTGETGGDEGKNYTRHEALKTAGILTEETEVPEVTEAGEEVEEKEVGEEGEEAANATSNDYVEPSGKIKTLRIYETEVKGQGGGTIDYYPMGRLYRTSSHPVMYRTKIQPFGDDVGATRTIKWRSSPVRYTKFRRSQPVATYEKEHYLNVKRRYANKDEDSSVDTFTSESREDLSESVEDEE